MNNFREFAACIRADLPRYRELWREAEGAGSATLLFSSLLVLLGLRGISWMNAAANRRRGFLVKRIAARLRNVVSRTMICAFKVAVNPETVLHAGVFFSGRGGIIVGAKSIGRNCTLHDAVTIGMDRDRGRPVIGERVWIGRNCVIFGDVTIGDGCILMEGTVLGKSVPDRCVVAGNPGRIMERQFDNAHLLKTMRTGSPTMRGADRGRGIG